MKKAPFQFKKFSVKQDQSAMKVGTDGVLLGCWVTLEGVSSVLDVGTGTGLIALILAQRCEAMQGSGDIRNLHIDAIEVDKNAAEEAAENFKQSPWSSNLKARHISFHDLCQKQPDKYDLLICNPPFFAAPSGMSDNPRARARYTISLHYEEILFKAVNICKPGGRLALILPSDENVEEKAIKLGWYPSRITRVKPNYDLPPVRCLYEFERTKRICSEDMLAIENGVRHQYTEEYQKLTREFYLKM